MTTPANIDVMIQTLDEEKNIAWAIESVRPWARRVFVIDSGSRDRTVEIAREMGATVVHQEWLGYARQKNFGLDNLPFESDWIFILDADELILPELRDEMIAIASRPVDAARPTDPVGYHVNRYFIFLEKRIRHCGYYPSWNLRFFRRGRARYEERDVHEHMIVDGPVDYLRGHMEHNDRRGLEVYVAKHNRYSTLEAKEILDRLAKGGDENIKARFFGDPLERRRWIKHRIYPRLPMKWLFRFLYMYVFRLGFLDGLTGFRFCLFLAFYEFLIQLKMIELRCERRAAVPSPEVAEPA